MTNDINIPKKTSWSRGLHRIFAIICIVWAGYFIIWIPVTISNERVKNSAEIRKIPLSNNNYTKQQIQGYDDLADKIFESSKLKNIYKEMMPDFHIFASFILIPPFVVYLLIRLLIFIIKWIYNGFKAD